MDSSADYARRVHARSSTSSGSEHTGMASPQYRQQQQQHSVDHQLFPHAGGYNNMALRSEQQQQLDPGVGVSQDGSLSLFPAEAVHYSPSDLAGWIDCMIDDLQPPSSSQAQLHTQQQQQHSPTPTHSSFVSMESSLDSMDSQAPLQAALTSGATVIMPDTYAAAAGAGADDYSDSMAGDLRSPEETGLEESGVRLVHLLLSCAGAVQRNEVRLAEETVKRIQMLATPQRGPMGKVAAHFVDALARRIFAVTAEPSSDPLTELMHFQFYETSPLLKFAHLTANQAILEAVQNCKRIHVIDCNLMHGLQWPALIQALALRPGGSPVFRLTGIGPPHQNGNDVLKEIGMKLAQLADLVGVSFEFRGVYAQKLDDVKPYMLHVRQGEAVCVNAVMQLHRLLNDENNTVPAVHEVLQSMRVLNPKIVTLVEQEANHNGPVFLERFMEALHYYSTMFDSLEACGTSGRSSEQLLAEMYVGKEICNIVACEGFDRVERHEGLAQWKRRMTEAGFRQRHLGPNTFKQASMLLTLFQGDGHRIEENSGCLTLGWQSRPLISASAWHCS